MRKIDTETSVNGQFIDGNASTGVKATRLNASWFNSVQDELVNAIGEENLNPNNNHQIADTIHKVKTDEDDEADYLENKFPKENTRPPVSGAHLIGDVYFSKTNNPDVGTHGDLLIPIIREDAIKREHIEDGAIGFNKIANASIVSSKLATGVIQPEHLNSNLINGNHIMPNAINGQHISKNSVLDVNQLFTENDVICGGRVVSNGNSSVIKQLYVPEELTTNTLNANNADIKLKSLSFAAFNPAYFIGSEGGTDVDLTNINEQTIADDKQVILVFNNSRLEIKTYFRYYAISMDPPTFLKPYVKIGRYGSCLFWCTGMDLGKCQFSPLSACEVFNDHI